MSDRDFEFGGRKFKLNKIDAFKQFHIVRRIGPIISDLVGAVAGHKVKDFNTLTEDAKLDMIAKIATPVMMGLSKLSDTDADLVLLGLLQSVEIQSSSGNWARVANNSMLMFQDLELPALLQIAGRAFMFNLSGFFAALPQK
jgi:hypothetical protein